MNVKSSSIAALALVSIAALPGCGVGEASISAAGPAADAVPVPVQTALPTRGDVQATYRATSVVESDQDAPVLARVAGEVVELLAEEGDRVAAGDVLARLDGERLRLEMLEARTALDKSRGELQRYTELAGRGLVSEAMFDGLRYDVDALAAGYERRKLNYEYSNIRAPIAGVVASRYVKPGEHLGADHVAYRVTNDTELLAYLQIPQAELGKFAAGHAATVTVDSAPDRRLPARIVRISPTIDAKSGTFRATAAIDNRDGVLVPGMFARFTIAYETHDNVLLIPATALVREDEEAAVYVVGEDGRASRRVIETGIASGGQVEVVSGLEENEEIVVLGHGSLRDGSKVLASNRKPSKLAG